MRYVAAMLVCAATGMAQQVTSVDKLPAAVSGFDDAEVHQTLNCSVHPVKPVLNFGFRFQTGYTIETSYDPYLGDRHHWYIVFRVTPQSGSGQDSGSPVYFLDSVDVPQPREAGFLVDNTGSFQVGEGRYDVKWALFDDLGRFCRKEWTVDAHPGAGERPAEVTMPPGTVGDFSWRPAATGNGVAKSRHVTILLNATIPVGSFWFPPATDQWGMLMSMLSSLVEEMPEASLRVVAFDTAQHEELFRKDDFTPEDINDVAHVVNAKERWTVGYQVLQNPDGEWDLLRSLEDKEIHSPSQADTVIFLGVPQGRFDKLAPGMLGPQAAPRVFYLKYRPMRPPKPESARESHDISGPGEVATLQPIPPPNPADLQDLIDQSVGHLKGKTLVISLPSDFNKAIATIRR